MCAFCGKRADDVARTGEYRCEGAHSLVKVDGHKPMCEKCGLRPNDKHWKAEKCDGEHSFRKLDAYKPMCTQCGVRADKVIKAAKSGASVELHLCAPADSRHLLAKLDGHHPMCRKCGKRPKDKHWDPHNCKGGHRGHYFSKLDGHRPMCAQCGIRADVIRADILRLNDDEDVAICDGTHDLVKVDHHKPMCTMCCQRPDSKEWGTGCPRCPANLGHSQGKLPWSHATEEYSRGKLLAQPWTQAEECTIRAYVDAGRRKPCMPVDDPVSWETIASQLSGRTAKRTAKEIAEHWRRAIPAPAAPQTGSAHDSLRWGPRAPMVPGTGWGTTGSMVHVPAVIN